MDHKRTVGDALDGWVRAIKDQRFHDEYESRMRLYVRPIFDTTPLANQAQADRPPHCARGTRGIDRQRGFSSS